MAFHNVFQFGMPDYTKRQMRAPSQVSNAEQYGQDFVSHLRVGETGLIMVVTDGHGTNGERWSRLANLELGRRITQHWDTLEGLLTGTNQSRLYKIERNIHLIFREVEQTVITEMGSDKYRGGTTASLSIAIMAGGRRYVIQAAVGDSPVGMYCRGKVSHTVTEASGDNQQAVREMFERYRRRKMTPPTVRFNRINNPGHPVQVEWPVGSGRFDPIPAWLETPEGPIPNVPGYEAIRLQSGHYYGTQSRNVPPIYYRSSDGAWVVRPGYEASNWGNTCVKGDGQNLTGIGDLMAGLASDCDTKVSITEQSDECLVWSWTDGIGDLFSTPKLCESILKFHRERGARELNVGVVGMMEDEITDEPTYAFRDGYPQHDDCACVGVLLPALNPSAALHVTPSG